MNPVVKILRVLLAGAFGGLVNSTTLWAFGAAGITPALGFQMAPPMSMAWLMPRLIPSAVWGLLFLLPFWNRELFKKGLVLSLPLWLVMVLVVFPKKMGAGMFGLKLGAAAPLWTLFFTLLWGVAAALVLDFVWKEKK